MNIITLKVMEKLNELIAECVLKNVLFEGNLGSTAYTVQDLVTSTTKSTINKMWSKRKKELSSLDSDSLFTNGSKSIEAKKKRLNLQIDTLAGVFKLIETRDKAKEERATLAKEKFEKLSLFKAARKDKEMEEFSKLSLAEQEAKIAELENV